MTLGTILFWGGLGGLAVFSLAGLVAYLVLKHRGRKLRREIRNEYG